MSAVSLVPRTAPVLFLLDKQYVIVCRHLYRRLTGSLRGSVCVSVCLTLCVHSNFLSASTCWFLHEHQCLFVCLRCAFVWLSCLCVCVCLSAPTPHPSPPAGSVSCACCADNQCVTSAGSVQQEQGTGLISTHSHTHTAHFNNDGNLIYCLKVCMFACMFEYIYFEMTEDFNLADVYVKQWFVFSLQPMYTLAFCNETLDLDLCLLSYCF